MTANHAEKILEVRGLTKTYGGEAKKGAKQPPHPGCPEGHRHRHLPRRCGLPDRPLRLWQVHLPALPEPAGDPHRRLHQFEGIEVDDAHIDAVRQKMGMVFQHFNLFPHLTVKQNLCLAPELLKLRARRRLPSVPRSCWPVSACPIKPMCSPRAFPAASSSALPLPALWPWTRMSSCSTSPPPPLTLRWSARCWS